MMMMIQQTNLSKLMNDVLVFTVVVIVSAANAAAAATAAVITALTTTTAVTFSFSLRAISHSVDDTSTYCRHCIL